jgi:hypothetical protein
VLGGEPARKDIASIPAVAELKADLMIFIGPYRLEVCDLCFLALNARVKNPVVIMVTTA